MGAQSELVLNLWAIYDAGVGMIYGLAGRAYCLSGSDEQKLAMLRSLSSTDHVTAKRFRVPDRFSVQCSDGTVRMSVAPMQAIHDPAAQLFEEMFDNVAADLPPLMEGRGEEFVPRKQSIPAEPLCVVTVLYEDEEGAIRALVTDEDRKWSLAEEVRRGRSNAV